jgi:hypothetical protein
MASLEGESELAFNYLSKSDICPDERGVFGEMASLEVESELAFNYLSKSEICPDERGVFGERGSLIRGDLW